MRKHAGGSKAKIALAVLFLAIAGGAGYWYRNEIFAALRVLGVAPCSAPITYRIGAVDARFGLSVPAFKQDIAAAADIWNKTAGRTLFQYSDTGTMPINLTYDSRQQATDQLRKLGLNVDSTQASYDKLKAAYDTDKAQYDAQNKQYAADLQQFNAETQAYDQAVRQANARGGANPAEFQNLSAERDRLNALSDTLNAEVAALNRQADTVNALAITLNRIGTQLNVDVSAYNVTGKNLGEFEEGAYVMQGLSQTIDIYQFDNQSALVRVLAHELGHSLGLAHVDDPNAIMYKLNQSKNAKPTAADLAELKRACRF